MKMIGKFATSLVAVGAFSAIIFANTSADDSSFRVAGEKQDSSLGNLPSGYTAAEYQRANYAVAGEKQDSGLGDLPANYAAAEY